ncbi:cytochrome P450 [Ramlibacter sp.]|uniref:cytochrome P450 n=1 Tax=Ramlibacter sp. TaxID=1917967 RepID=UPI002B92F9C3|nr:cytochrome P450 [Ramlibacter sp.]HWI83100.1 cytochrome P450 [Ramlibacter sp.]
MATIRHEVQDWDPRAPEVLRDQVAAYDGMRRRCPVAHSDYLQWSLFRHEDVLAAVLDHETFGNQVSAHPAVPNGMDPPRHTPYRALIEPYFDRPRLAAHEPVCRQLVARLVDALPRAGELEWMEGFAHECAAQMLCAFMGWSSALHEPLRAWNRRNQAATLAGDRTAMAAIALEFDGHIRAQLSLHRAAGAATGTDVTSRLLRDTVDGRPLTDEELVSIARNWTVGELGTMAAAIGILADFLATHRELQQTLRRQPRLVPAAIDEILRIRAPLIANRRVVRRPVDIGGAALEPGDRVTLVWASANRDERVFGDPDEFRLDRDPALNLLYGAGVHVCPGAPLARLQLRIVLQTLLANSRGIARVEGRAPVKARYPAGGYSALPLRIDRA